MPRRKRNRARESEHDAASVPHKRRHTENTRETLFVSDSDNEEEESRPTSREVRLREREHKTLTEDLTEEEMVNLAMKLSAEEATNAALRQKEEDEAVDRAIAESLHVNHTQTELVSLEMSQDTPSSLGDIPPSAPESPVFPSRQQRSHLDSSETGLDVIARNDILHSVDAKGNLGSSQPLMSEERDSKLPTSPVQSSASEKPDALLKQKRHDAGSTSQITQAPSTFSSALGEDSVNYRRGSPFPSPVLCIQRLSQELLDDCQASGFIRCSQELPVCLTPSGGSKVFRQRSLMSSEMNWGSVERAGPSSAVASSVKETTTSCAGTQDADDSPCSQVLRAENCGDALSLLPGRKMLPAGPKHAPAEHTAGARGVCNKSGASLVLGEEDPCKRKSLPERNGKWSFFQVTNEDDELCTQINLRRSEGEEEDDDEDPGSKRHRLAPDVMSPLGPQSVESDSADDGDLVPSPVFPGLRPHGSGDVSPRHTPRHLHVQRKLPFEHMSPPNMGVVPGQEEIAAFGTSLETVDSRQQGMECGSVRYYWGVPFCPRGQDPDLYTRAIVTQLEVYEKSLKEARRGLLRKAEWGDPVLPAPPGRHKRSRTPRLPDEEEEDEQEEEEATAEEEMVERNECADSPRSAEEAEGKGEEEENGDTEEASSQQGKSTEQSVPEEIPGKHKSLRKRRVRKASLAEVETCPAAELDPQGAASCPDRQLDGQHLADNQRGSPDHTQVHSVDSDCEVMVLDQETSAPAGGAAEVQEEAVGQTETESCSKWVQCPICMRRFPRERIEMHAAYCNAMAEDQVLQEPFSQVTGRKQNNRRSKAIDETQPSPLSISSRMQRMEKCYLCQRMLSVKDYNGHVDECIRTTSARNQEGKNLLLTLDQLEQSEEPEASEPEPALDSTRRKGHSSATLWDKNESEDQGAPSAKPGLSSSPIRSFTSISEATDCLVDFKRYSAKPGQRGRRRRFK